MYTLYMHVTPSNKKYIGITRNKPTTRWRNGSGYVGNTHFFNAIQKYGWNNIQHIVLKTKLSEEEAKNQEVALIAKYETQDRNKGYNITKGGDTNVPLIGPLNGMYGKTHSKNAKKTISEKALKRFTNKENHPMYGKPRSEATKLKMSKSRKGISAGENNYFYGKNKSGKDAWRYGTKHSEETKRKLSEIRKGRYKGDKAYNATPIRCVETTEVFSCAMAIKEKYGYDNSAIGKCCKGVYKSAYGLHWEYVSKDKKQQ